MGNTARLVGTPLTDRAHLTIGTALWMCCGAALAGPSGTGKTETVKDLAKAKPYSHVVLTSSVHTSHSHLLFTPSVHTKALARPCVSINCTPAHGVPLVARALRGAARVGAWGCFDELNLLPAGVLSVVAQQLLALQQALAASAPSSPPT